LIKMEIDTTIW